MSGLVHVFLFLSTLCITNSVRHDWDMAVAIEDKIEFLNKNATLVGISHQVFHNLKAVTFDDMRHQLIVSDMYEKNDTIYKIKLSDSGSSVPIAQNLVDDVVDVAIDPVEDILYWVDSYQKKIMKIGLNNSEAQSEVVFEFKDEIPQGIAVDSCRRKLYWTNANHPFATIERSNLDGSGREVIVQGNMFMPSGITIDYGSRRIYWADRGEGIYFRIETAKFDGSNRRIIYEDTHQSPFAIAVSETSIFWTDLTNYALWGMNKDETGLKPQIVRRFNEKPMGLITKNHEFSNMPECQEVVDAINGYLGSSAEDIVPANSSDYCLNYGEMTLYGCKCSRGFAGPRCQIDLCHNLCINGNCYQSSQGYPKCKCQSGFVGERCEHELCNNFCMNGGICSNSLKNSSWPKCSCPEGFSGIRCENKDQSELVCSCDNGIVIKPVDGTNPFCSCPSSTNSPPLTTLPLQRQLPSITDRLQDPLVMAFIFLSCLLLILTCALSIGLCKLRHRRPRIKKRIIVNKNVTPLTCRPNPPSEQCEITIENCCNMNICETPCFEPTQIRNFQRNKTEEKKTLLTSMENGEDLY